MKLVFLPLLQYFSIIINIIYMPNFLYSQQPPYIKITSIVAIVKLTLHPVSSISVSKNILDSSHNSACAPSSSRN